MSEPINPAEPVGERVAAVAGPSVDPWASLEIRIDATESGLEGTLRVFPIEELSEMARINGGGQVVQFPSLDGVQDEPPQRSSSPAVNATERILEAIQGCTAEEAQRICTAALNLYGLDANNAYRLRIEHDNERVQDLIRFTHDHLDEDNETA